LLGDEVYRDKNIENNIYSKLQATNNYCLKIKSLLTRLMLHSAKLSFIDQEGVLKKYEAPMPEEFQTVIDFLDKYNEEYK